MSWECGGVEVCCATYGGQGGMFSRRLFVRASVVGLDPHGRVFRSPTEKSAQPIRHEQNPCIFVCIAMEIYEWSRLYFFAGGMALLKCCRVIRWLPMPVVATYRWSAETSVLDDYG
jgi:hypothetical protein